MYLCALIPHLCRYCCCFCCYFYFKVVIYRNLPCFKIQQRLSKSKTLDCQSSQLYSSFIWSYVLHTTGPTRQSCLLLSFPFTTIWFSLGILLELCLFICIFVRWISLFYCVFFTCLGCNLIIFWVVLVNENVSKSCVIWSASVKNLKIDKLRWTNTLQSASKIILIHNS